MIRSAANTKALRSVACLLFGLWCGQGLSTAESPVTYATGAHPFPAILRPYRPWQIPPADLSNSDTLQSAIRDGEARLSMDVLVRAVVENNLGVALARFYPSIAQTDLLRSHSGASPRGVDAAEIPSSIFAGAEGGSILGTAAAGGGGGVNNAGGITGAAGAVNISPAGVFDPRLSVTFSVDHTSSPLNTLVVAGVPAVTTGTGAASVNYVQAFSSGTGFQVSYAFQRQGSTQRRLLFDPAFTPGFTASVSQQMVNGFGFRVNRALIEVAENEQKIERQSFRQQLIAQLANAKNAYWDLVAAKESVRAAQEALVAAQQLAENNRMKVESGTMAHLDLATAEAQVAASQRDLIVTQTNLQNAGLLLKTTFTKNLAEPWASAVIEPTDTFPNPDDTQLPRLEDAVKIANENRPEVSIALGNIKSQTDVLPFLRNALLPTVNAFALVSNVGLNNFFGTAFSEAVQFRYPQFAFGVSITFPVRNRQAQADDIRARMELDQSKDNLVRTQSQVEVDVQNALIATTQSRAQVAAARETVRLQRQRLEAELLKFQEGLSTPYNVVLVQRDLLTAQLAEVQALDAYAKAGVTLDLAMGTTLESNHVDLDDALRGGVRRSSGRN
jgi:outer membrane protein